MNKDWKEWISYETVAAPVIDPAAVPVDLTDATMRQHREKVLKAMEQKQLDCLLIYGDREHGTNFGYLAGFEPRFEESLIALHKDGTAYMLLGNEALRLAQYSRIPVTAIHVPHLSLPNQPMKTDKTLTALFQDAGIGSGMQVGIAGWKMFTSALEENDQLFDVPHFIVSAVKQAVGSSGRLLSAGDLFIHPGYGVRCIMNANEIAHYEFGASLAGAKVFSVLEKLEPGITELELADLLHAWGQPISVQTICATGDRFTNAVVAPRNKAVTVGDKFSVTMGLRGGLTSRSGYAVSSADQLSAGERDYLNRIAAPYFGAAVTWYENMVLGKTGNDIYTTIESVFPKAVYGWELNPGHLTAGEEWLSSPIYPDSTSTLKSGMLFQMDIIPKAEGLGGVSAEDGIALADAALRQELAEQYPAVWQRMQRRRVYMQDTLGMKLPEEVLPLSDTNGYLRPYLLNKQFALRVKK